VRISPTTSSLHRRGGIDAFQQQYLDFLLVLHGLGRPRLGLLGRGRGRIRRRSRPIANRALGLDRGEDLVQQHRDHVADIQRVDRDIVFLCGIGRQLLDDAGKRHAVLAGGILRTDMVTELGTNQVTTLFDQIIDRWLGRSRLRSCRLRRRLLWRRLLWRLRLRRLLLRRLLCALPHGHNIAGRGLRRARSCISSTTKHNQPLESIN
jgi:hypothetical protein